MGHLFKRVGLALGCAATIVLGACGGPGSCRVSMSDSSAGFNYCKDYLGSEFNQSVAQNDCSTLGGSYQPDFCSTTGSLGTCTVGAGTAMDFQYTYSASGSAPVAQVTLESACGVAGGTFNAR